jgi:hypothetical protein
MTDHTALFSEMGWRRKADVDAGDCWKSADVTGSLLLGALAGAAPAGVAKNRARCSASRAVSDRVPRGTANRA